MGWLPAWIPPLVRFQPGGEHHVGVRDLSWLHPQDNELHPQKHLSARIYFPSATAPSLWVPWRWPMVWLPAAMYARGYGEALIPPIHKGFKVTLTRLAIVILIFLLGNTAAIPAVYGAPLLAERGSSSPEPGAGPESGRTDGKTKAEEAGKRKRRGMPVVIISHGYSGTRSIHSSLACELASRGYIVVAVEHADGSSSLTRLAPGIKPESLPRRVLGSKWLLNGDWGEQEVQMERTRWRVKELMTAHALLSALHQGLHVDGLIVTGIPSGNPGIPTTTAIHHPYVGTCLSAPQQPPTSTARYASKRPATTTASFLAGRLDMSRVAVVGHSWGGVTTALAVSEHLEFAAGVALDPWWKVLPPECSALNGKWATRSPLLVLGSHEWNGEPDAKGELPCNKGKRDKVLAAAAAGAGALMLVPKGSTHHSFDDILLFFQDLMQPILTVFGFHSRLHPKRALDLVLRSMLHFLDRHVHTAQQPRRTPAAAESGGPAGSPLLPLPFAATHLRPYINMFGADLQSHTLTLANANTQISQSGERV